MLLTKDRLAAVLGVYMAFVFIQSLFYKFSNSAETQHIFGTLDAWAAGFGAAGLFAPTGLFSQYVIGGAELVASALILAGTLAGGLRALQGLGGIFGTAIMTGAIGFHLFTPLGVEVQGDGGTLFIMACGVWLSGVVLLAMRRADILAVRLSL